MKRLLATVFLLMITAALSGLAPMERDAPPGPLPPPRPAPTIHIL